MVSTLLLNSSRNQYLKTKSNWHWRVLRQPLPPTNDVVNTSTRQQRHTNNTLYWPLSIWSIVNVCKCRLRLCLRDTVFVAVDSSCRIACRLQRCTFNKGVGSNELQAKHNSISSSLLVFSFTNTVCRQHIKCNCKHRNRQLITITPVI